ncbi:MAG: hypothetical protein IT561_09560, partial [Alphaproteobacteria bacterium]|nr:hypothetical protein [Alphaproteobacteria bacterium]
SRALLERLARRELTVDGFQDAIARLHAELDLPRLLAPWIERSLAERRNQVLYRRTFATGRETIQLFNLEPHEVHPPHGHHNIVSTQVVLAGRVRCREYDRVARLDADTLLLRPRFDGWLEVGDAMRTTEVERNVHWFAAGDAPAVMLNFSAYGYQDWTFDGKDRPFRRSLVDPAQGTTPDGLAIAREADVETVYARFGGRPIDDFPLP